MANRLGHVQRAGLGAAGALLLGAIGCAFPHGSTGGDPLLGNFNRPIVPTPPPERAGLGPDSPAYDAGSRIGITPPDVPIPGENTPGFMTLPNLTYPNLQSQNTPPSDSSNPAPTSKPAPAAGARLPLPGNAVKPLPLPAATGEPTAGPFLPPPVRRASHEATADPDLIRTVEEGHTALAAMGSKGQRLEQTESGDWRFSCVRGSRLFEARHAERLEALRAVMEQVRQER
ncbi:MAG TPA: hypothetical protein VKD90_26035 [Gemmataceae bacterium]|nr:hypothetical protein [Gemmataceae bacterium]